MENKVKNLDLYRSVREEAKKKFKVWPSAYASGWMVREYKKRGGEYKDTVDNKNNKNNKNNMNNKKKDPTLLHRWFLEEWINVCELPKIVPCGRPKSSFENYPYCRPRKRVSPETPKTASELSEQDIKTRCAKKRKRPMDRIMDTTK